jgi:hypothetical protein
MATRRNEVEVGMDSTIDSWGPDHKSIKTNYHIEITFKMNVFTSVVNI